MEGRTVLLVVFLCLSISLLTVPSISLYYYGCHAGTKGLFEWLPRPWPTSSAGSHPCEAGEVLRNGYQALCPQPSKDALEELLDNIGFFGPRESQELTLCRYGKSSWKSVRSLLSGVYDTSLGLHGTVTKSLTENSISLERLLEEMLETVKDAVGRIKELACQVKRRVIEPVLGIPSQIRQQYLEFLEMYQTIRDMQEKWSSPFSLFFHKSTGKSVNKEDGHTHVSKGYLATAVGYFTQDKGLPKLDHSELGHSAPPSLSSPSGVPSDSVQDNPEVAVEDTTTPGYMSQILHFVTNTQGSKSSDNVGDSSKVTDRYRPTVKGDMTKTLTLPETSSSDALGDDQAFEDPSPAGLTERDIIGSLTLKKVLFEALVATVMAFTLFILGIFVYRLRRAQMFGLQFPSLRQILVSKYKPIKGIGSSENFYKFHMISKRTREKVFVKYLRGKAGSLAVATFDDEQKCLKVLNHSNIVSIVESIRVGSRLCLVLEYAEYGNLTAALKKPVKPLGFYEKLHIYRQITEAVHWMHKLGWGHLNVRPASILVYEMWYLVKLSGFTKAVELHYGDHCNYYRLHAMCSPPRVMTRQAFNPAKADLWALGTLLFYLFTRRSIHTYGEAVRVARVVSNTDFYQNSQCGLNLVRILSDLLSFDPNNRPEIRELLLAINNV